MLRSGCKGSQKVSWKSTASVTHFRSLEILDGERKGMAARKRFFAPWPLQNYHQACSRPTYKFLFVYHVKPSYTDGNVVKSFKDTINPSVGSNPFLYSCPTEYDGNLMKIEEFKPKLAFLLSTCQQPL